MSMQSMTHKTVGPWPQGLDIKSADGALTPEALSEAKNVLIDDKGIVRPANKLVMQQSGAYRQILYSRNLKAVVTSSDTEITFYGQQVLITGDFTHARLCDAMGACIVHTPTKMFVITRKGAVTPVYLPPSPPPMVTEIGGGLLQGSYEVAVDSPSSPLSEAVIVSVTQGGLRLTDMQPGERIFVTNVDGSELLFHGVAMTDTYDITEPPTGPVFTELNLEMLPYGQILTAGGMRVLSAVGRTLWYSVPSRPGLCDKETNFIRYESDITLVHSMGLHTFVGTKEGLFRVTNLGEKTQVQESVYAGDVLPVTPCSIDLSQYSDEEAGSGFVFASTDGICIAARTGRVLAPQADKIALPPDTTGVLVYYNDRITLIGANND